MAHHSQQHPQQYATTSNAFMAHHPGPSHAQSPGTPMMNVGQNTVAPLVTTSQGLVATGDWTKDLVHLAKTAELKKHALTLQLHTAHILSAHASLEQKGKAIQDIREQKNKLESERTRLLNCLREINEDRDKADLLENSITRECTEIRNKIATLEEGEYAVAKQDVDRLRQELGQPPLPPLQATLDEKSSQYLNERRLNGGDAQKRSASDIPLESQSNTGKRPRGRPKGSKNRGGKPSSTSTSAAGASG
ncbi:hypothetical protein SERLA73DRAFT_142623 [Serpula lacrymans var. lacrymans S7.3]|uniref:Uncharacterized protein n=2 Tax=Serpula lacrymans var. lacrymans TaxID=341189 RepID=F8Q834_SERL3|nr:hypothetical protein SERLA73DRAFT_142623 [Serpula lacrymans var. lacrymans S7.3]